MSKRSSRKLDKELHKLNELRCRLHDVIKPDYDDDNLRKWLKARNYDLDKAELMFRNNAAFKEQMSVESLLTDYQPPEVIQKYLTGGFCGHDKDGSPVRVELFGHLDMKGLMASVRKSDLEKTKIMQCEWTVQEWERMSKVMGHRVDGLTVIFDMEAVTTKMMWRPGLQMYLHLVKLLEDNYPEMMKRLLVINAPRIFPILYKLCRPLISDEMRNKIHVLGSDYQSSLLKFIDDNQLPEFLGGTLTDPDGNPRLVTEICQGGEVPERYFLDNIELCAHMKTATIQPGHKHLVDFDVRKPGCILRWEFKTEGYDISFGVELKEKSKTWTTNIVPMGRVNSHVLAQDGSVTCEKVGTYYLVFDNSFSWTKSKRIYYDGDTSYIEDDYVRSEINDLIEEGEWETLASKFETTHL